MDASRLRQQIRLLDEQRRQLLGAVLRPLAMIGGSLYQMHRRCGRPGCRCTRGERHSSWYLSWRSGGRTRLLYLGRVVPERLAQRIRRYQEHQRALARIRKIDAEISRYLNQLRDEKVERPEQLRPRADDGPGRL